MDAMSALYIRLHPLLRSDLQPSADVALSVSQSVCLSACVICFLYFWAGDGVNDAHAIRTKLEKAIKAGIETRWRPPLW